MQLVPCGSAPDRMEVRGIEGGPEVSPPQASIVDPYSERALSANPFMYL